jgi:hypothetical protein
MNKATALEIAEEHFPNGPEHIAKALGAEVTYAAINVDGWCIPCGKSPIITINKDSPSTRQRFTLAHELAHLILGTKPDIVAGKDDFLYDPKGTDENEANQLASGLLLPLEPLRSILVPPIDAKSLAVTAKKCGVSEVALALRLIRNPYVFGLDNPVLTRLGDGKLMWSMPHNRSLAHSEADRLYNMALNNGGTCRTRSNEDEAIMVCASANVTYKLLLYYWLLPEHSYQETSNESRVRLEAMLYGNDSKTKQIVNACLGAFKPRMTGLDLEVAVQRFHERYGLRLSSKLLGKYPSREFDEYLRNRLSEWVSPAPAT